MWSFIAGMFVGGFVTLVLYACVVAGDDRDDD